MDLRKKEAILCNKTKDKCCEGTSQHLRSGWPVCSWRNQGGRVRKANQEIRGEESEPDYEKQWVIK